MDGYQNITKKTKLLSKSEEFELSSKIWQSREDLWACLLSYPPYTCQILDDIKSDIPDSFSALRSTNKKYRDRSTLKFQALFEKELKKAAQKISNIDLGILLFSKIYSNILLKKYRPRMKNSRILENYLKDLKRLLKEHRDFKNQFFNANIRLVFLIARKNDANLSPFEDIIQEGTTGLMTAIERFDPKRGFRFSTYATWWVRHTIGRYIQNHGRLVRWPSHVIGTLYQLKKFEPNILSFQDFDIEELSQKSGVSLKKIENVRKLREFIPISIDARIGDSINISDTIKDEDQSAEEILEFNYGFENIKDEIEKLPGLWREIIERRFGLFGNKEETLQEIANDHRLSRERIRQIQQAALERLKENVI
jgi:RNA polymerase primary sigma factor